MTDSQLFTVQPIAIQQLSPGLHYALYNKQSINQEIRDPSTNKLDIDATNELSEAIYEKLSNQLNLNSNTHLYPIGSLQSLQDCSYISSIPPTLLSIVNFLEQILFLRIETTTPQPN
jgi:hypothetical protein